MFKSIVKRVGIMIILIAMTMLCVYGEYAISTALNLKIHGMEYIEYYLWYTSEHQIAVMIECVLIGITLTIITNALYYSTEKR